MASLIESLVDAPIVRHDNKRLTVTQRPAPTRLREVLEVFGAMGRTASFAGARRSFDLRSANPVLLANAVLGRWLTNDELAAFGTDYNAWRHLSRMLLSEEFRIAFIRRVLDAFPEKIRLLHVRIPSCAGRHAVAMLEASCPLLPLDIASPRYAEQDEFGPFLGSLFNRMNAARSAAISLPTMAPFVDPPAAGKPGRDILGWHFQAPPCRAIDQLFAVVRSPVSLALSQVNGTLTMLRDQPEAPGLQVIRQHIGRLPQPGRTQAWQRLGRGLLAENLPTNPICSALADGTAAGAFAACARAPVQLVSLTDYTEWSRPSVDASPIDPIGVSEPFLSPSDLTAEEHAIIQSCMGEDMIFYDRFIKRIEATGLPMVRGPEL